MGLLALAYLAVTQLEEEPLALQCAFGRQAAEMGPERSARLISLQSYILQGRKTGLFPSFTHITEV